jgi:RimJ/RimL family protein N-acetyltransferase
MLNSPHVSRHRLQDTFTVARGLEFPQWLSPRNPGEPGWFQFALENPSVGSFISDCRLPIREDDGRPAQIGYTISRSNWNKGFATDAITAVVGYAFQTFPIHCISASVDVPHIGSCRILDKMGFNKQAQFLKSERFMGE